MGPYWTGGPRGRYIALYVAVSRGGAWTARDYRAYNIEYMQGTRSTIWYACVMSIVRGRVRAYV